MKKKEIDALERELRGILNNIYCMRTYYKGRARWDRLRESIPEPHRSEIEYGLCNADNEGTYLTPTDHWWIRECMETYLAELKGTEPPDPDSYYPTSNHMPRELKFGYLSKLSKWNGEDEKDKFSVKSLRRRGADAFEAYPRSIRIRETK